MLDPFSQCSLQISPYGLSLSAGKFTTYWEGQGGCDRFFGFVFVIPVGYLVVDGQCISCQVHMWYLTDVACLVI